MAELYAQSEESLVVRYTFTLPDRPPRVHEVRMDPHTLAGPPPSGEGQPWTALTFKQCPNCPLNTAESPQCPLAFSLIDLVQLCTDIASYDTLEVEVTTPERTIRRQTTAQRAVASLMGLVMATSGCPHTRVFRPMARFHLPLATEEETIYRATSMYLLAQYFARERGWTMDAELEGLSQLYREMHKVNTCIAKRLWSVVKTDSSVNALVLLDLFSKALPDTIEDSLDEIKYLFEPVLEAMANSNKTMT
ncbi:MAG: DUF6901 family protein [Bradymonadia bacterium]